MDRLIATYLEDKEGKRVGASCHLPNGMELRVDAGKPMSALCRQLLSLGFGDWHVSLVSPGGTPAQSCIVKHGCPLS